MSVTSRLLAAVAGLPPASTYEIGVERNLRVPMPDGVVLLADRYFPRRDSKAPIVLARGPYGPRSLFGVIGRLFAERGYQAVVQSVRGTFGSGGAFDPLRHEATDGRATLEWLAAQPWFGGSVGMFGPSYLGFTQWAVAAGAPPYLKALAPHITASQFRGLAYPSEAFALDTLLTWMHFVAHQELHWWQAARAILWQRRDLAPALRSVPLREADRRAVGREVPFFQDWLTHERSADPYWESIDHSRAFDAVSAPANLVAGWYDIFLPEQLADYASLRRAGRSARLTVGPWKHIDLAVYPTSLRETLAWFDVHLRGRHSDGARSPIRVFLMGARVWLDLQDWPPPATPRRWHLQGGGGLARQPAPHAPPDLYDYDPADPTPAVGGIVLGPHAGPKDNRRLESRRDVLTYTSATLERDLDVIGSVAVELYVRSSLEHTDFFARLCDVAPNGRSVNVCDGLARLGEGAPRSADGSTCVRVALWPTAYRFMGGHRLRLQVSSGAHPRYNRNLGGGEPLATAATFHVAHQEVFHDPAHPSALILPVPL